MTLEEKIMQDLKEAMKARDEAALRGIRAVKAAILLVKTDGSGKPIDTEREIQILQKLVKQRKESLEIFEKQNREDLAKKERDEIAVIEKYLPQQMNESELETILQEIIDKVGATSVKDLGKVMGLASKELAGKSDGKMIAQVTKRLLDN